MSILDNPKGFAVDFGHVGDQVTAGQPIVQYRVRRPNITMQQPFVLSIADRQLNDLLTNGVTIDTTG